MDYSDGSISGSPFNKQANDLAIPLKSSRAPVKSSDSILSFRSSKNGHKDCGVYAYMWKKLSAHSLQAVVVGCEMHLPTLEIKSSMVEARAALYVLECFS